MRMIEFPKDYLDVRAMLAESMQRYARLHGDSETAAEHPPVTRIDLEIDLQEPSVDLHLDTRPGGWPGEGTHPHFASLAFPNWRPLLDAHGRGEALEVRGMDGRVRLVSDAKFDRVFHGFFADALLAARNDGIFESLPKAPMCELGVACFECGYFWPEEYERGLENLADPREAGRRISTYPAPPEEQRVAEDSNAYDVWVDSGEMTVAAAAVALSGVLGIGLPEAKSVLESRQPIARDVKAPEVQRLARLLRAAGISVHVDPEFRWKL